MGLGFRCDVLISLLCAFSACATFVAAAAAAEVAAAAAAPAGGRLGRQDPDLQGPCWFQHRPASLLLRFTVGPVCNLGKRVVTFMASTSPDCKKRV